MGNESSMAIRTRYRRGRSRNPHRAWTNGKKVRHPTAITLFHKKRKSRKLTIQVTQTKSHKTIGAIRVSGNKRNRKFLKVNVVDKSANTTRAIELPKTIPPTTSSSESLISPQISPLIKR